MTIPSTSRKAGPLLGTGAQTAWPFTFKVFAASDIAVTIADSLGIETALVLDTDYSVTLNANQETSPGGTVTYPISGTPLAVGSKLSIIGDLDYDQPLDLPSGGNFSPLALENELDRLTMQIQQVKETAGRALLVPVTSIASSALPAPEANKLIAWNETASALQNLSVSEIASVVAYGTAASDIFTGTGAQTAFVLSNNPGALNNLDVAIGGVTQLPGVDYTWSSGTTVTFTTAPPFGAKVLIRYMQALALGTADAGSVQYTPAGVSAMPTTVQAKLRESVSVLDFGAVGDGVTNNASAFAAAKTYINSLTVPCELVFPAGIYLTSTSQNWFKQNFTMRALGKVVIKSSAASGNILSIDAGAAVNGYRFNMLGNFVLDTVAGGCGTGLYMRNVHHSNIEVDVRNVSSVAVQIDGAVLNKYKIRCSAAGDAFTTTPVNGVIISSSAIISSTTDCEFDLIVETASSHGVVLTAVSNSIFKGTSEGVGGTGLQLSANAIGNTFVEFFMEANSVGGDIDCYGKRNIFINCVSSSRAATPPYESVKSIILRNGSEQNRFTGSQLYAATVEAGAIANSFEYCDSQYAIADSGTRTQILYTRQLFNSSSIVPGWKAGNLANTDPAVLDWYEEGTFTPYFGGSTSDGTITHDIQSGQFTRIGNTVFFNLTVRVSSIISSPTGNLLVKGLPYTPAATPTQQSVFIGNWDSITLPASRVSLNAYLTASTAQIRLTGCASGVAASLVQGSGLAASTLALSGSYPV